MADEWTVEDYAKTIGKITIEWNYLERRLNSIAYMYMGGDSDVAGYIFGAMRNVTKSEFFGFLAEKFEPDERIRTYVHHLIRAFNIIRENRNIISHSVPITHGQDEIYQDEVVKSDKVGYPKYFTASREQLDKILADIKSYSNYCLLITALHEPDAPPPEGGGISFRDAFASLDKPPLPRKIDPRPPEEGL